MVSLSLPLHAFCAFHPPWIFLSQLAIAYNQLGVELYSARNFAQVEEIKAPNLCSWDFVMHTFSFHPEKSNAGWISILIRVVMNFLDVAGQRIHTAMEDSDRDQWSLYRILTLVGLPWWFAGLGGLYRSSRTRFDFFCGTRQQRRLPARNGGGQFLICEINM